MLRFLIAAVLLCITSVHAKHVSVFFVGGQSNATTTYKNAIQSALTASGQYESVLVAHATHGGSSISHWMTNTTTHYYEDDFFNMTGTGVLQTAIAAISRADTYSFEGLFWFQGEADRYAPANWVSLFKDAPHSLLNRLRTDLGSSNWKYVVTLVDNYTTDPIETAAYNGIRDAMRTMVNTDPTYGRTADSRGYERRASDGLHLVDSAYTQFGGDSVGMFFGTLSKPLAPTTPQITNLQASLTWSPVTHARGYRAKRTTISGGPYVTAPIVQTSSFIDISAIPGVKNHYVVSAFNAAGESENSPEVNVVPRANLAYNRPVTASSGSNNASLAVDGNPATAWSSDASDPQWISVDLGAICQVDTVRIHWAAGYAKFYQIQLSLDGTTWTPHFTTTTGVGGVEIRTFTSTSARYVRMHGTQRTTTSGYSLWEIEVFGVFPANFPTTPTGLTAAVASSNQINLTWNTIPNAATYHLKRATTSGGPYTLLASAAGTGYNDTALTPRTPYYYVVSASNASGESVESAAVSATTRSVEANAGKTTGSTFDLLLPGTWTNDLPPLGGDVANFQHAGFYTAANGTTLNWLGMKFSVSGVELDPTTGNTVTINLGIGGIDGSSTRLGNTDDQLRINVGSTAQVWNSTQGNIGARIIGSGNAIINLDGPGAYWFRGNNSGFLGTWNLNNAGGTFQTGHASGLGGAGARLAMFSGTTLRATSNQSSPVRIALPGNTATIRQSANISLTLSGTLSGGDVTMPNTLTLTGDNGTANTLNLDGDLSGHVGSLILNRSNTTAPYTVKLGGNFSLKLGANQVVDGADTTTLRTIRAGSGTGVTHAIFNGTFTLDLTGAAIAHGNTWNLVDVANLTETFGATFTIPGFTRTADTWTHNEGANTWTFSETTGILSLAVIAPTAYATWASSAGLTAGVNDGSSLDPDHDGLNNLGEFAFAGNPLSGDASKKIIGKFTSIAGGEFFTLTLPVRSGATFNGINEQVSSPIDGLIYRIQRAEDLNNWNLPIAELTAPDAATIQFGLPALASGWTYRSFRAPSISGAGNPREFLRAVFESSANPTP